MGSFNTRCGVKSLSQQAQTIFARNLHRYSDANKSIDFRLSCALNGKSMLTILICFALKAPGTQIQTLGKFWTHSKEGLRESISVQVINTFTTSRNCDTTKWQEWLEATSGKVYQSTNSSSDCTMYIEKNIHIQIILHYTTCYYSYRLHEQLFI